MSASDAYDGEMTRAFGSRHRILNQLVGLGVLGAATVCAGPSDALGQVASPGSHVDLPEGDLAERLVEVDEKVYEGHFHEGLDAMRELAEEEPGDVEVLWRLSRVKTDVGFELGEDDPDQEKLYVAALELARDAVEADPDHPEAHVSAAIAAGRAAMVAGVRDRVELSREVLEHAEGALELAPDHDVAYHLRGRWHHEVATLGLVARTALKTIYGGLPDASLDDAVEDFRRAIELEDRVIHRFKLAKTLLEKGDEDEALRQLEKAVEMPLDAPRAHIQKERAEEILDDA